MHAAVPYDAPPGIIYFFKVWFLLVAHGLAFYFYYFYKTV